MRQSHQVAHRNTTKGLVALLLLVLPSAGPPAASATAVTGSAAPLSSSGCAGYVCVGIDGSGTTVDDIWASVQNPYTTSYATTGTIYDNGVAIHTFPRITVPPYPTEEQQTWSSPDYNFHAGDQILRIVHGDIWVPLRDDRVTASQAPGQMLTAARPCLSEPDAGRHDPTCQVVQPRTVVLSP